MLKMHLPQPFDTLVRRLVYTNPVCAQRLRLSDHYVQCWHRRRKQIPT